MHLASLDHPLEDKATAPRRAGLLKRAGHLLLQRDVIGRGRGVGRPRGGPGASCRGSRNPATLKNSFGNLGRCMRIPSLVLDAEMSSNTKGV